MAALLIGCKTSEDYASTDYQRIIHSSKVVNPSVQSPIESVDTVNLKCPDNIILGTVKNVYVADGMFVVVDNQSAVYGFAPDGTYMCTYGRRGDAPSEYVNMSACAVTPAGDEVVIIDSYAQRMLYYDAKSGEYKYRINFPTGSFDMAQQCVFINDSTALLARDVYGKNNSVYATINIADKTVETFASVEMSTANVAIPVGWHAISVYNGKGAYVKPFDPTIYQYVDTKWLFVEQDKKIYSSEELAKMTNYSLFTRSQAEIDGYFSGFTDIFVLKDWIFLANLSASFSLINKTSHEINTYKYETDETFDYINVSNIIGSIPDNNALIGTNNGPMSEDERFFIYHLAK
ncbi:MAG: 6-bladed beta-propeller [Muribaculaceae bacterium]|nr:6-bladed beta-propeller [Muribaculaceae bacterium]